MNRNTPIILVVLAASLACTVKKESPVDTLATTTSSTTVTQPTDSRVTGTITDAGTPGQGAIGQAPTKPPPDSSTPSAGTSFTVNEYGIGPIRAGMTVAEAARALGGGFGPPRGGADGCGYAVLTKAPPGLAVMVENGKVARVEVRSGSIRTSDGARIGDNETRIKSLYAGRVTSTPHKYTPNGHYLTVTPTDKSAPYRIVFETDGQRVTEYRSGQLPAVEYVERCG